MINRNLNPATVQVDAMVSVSRKRDSAILAKYGSDLVFIFRGKCELFSEEQPIGHLGVVLYANNNNRPVHTCLFLPSIQLAFDQTGHGF